MGLAGKATLGSCGRYRLCLAPSLRSGLGARRPLGEALPLLGRSESLPFIQLDCG